jgi:hypothetical protein
MKQFRLEKSSGSNTTVTKFNVVDEGGGIAGRICVSVEDEAALLACWKGPAPTAASAAARGKQNPMVGAMLSAARKHPMTTQAVLRGCR